MEGPLPLELQQIRADTQREEAALEAAKAALAAQRRKSEVSFQTVAIRLKMLAKQFRIIILKFENDDLFLFVYNFEWYNIFV